MIKAEQLRMKSDIGLTYVIFGVIQIVVMIFVMIHLSTTDQIRCPSYPHTSSCPGNGIYGDMFQNYMDYTNDACMNIFTQDQKLRMLAAINTSDKDY